MWGGPVWGHLCRDTFEKRTVEWGIWGRSCRRCLDAVWELRSQYSYKSWNENHANWRLREIFQHTVSCWTYAPVSSPRTFHTTFSSPPILNPLYVLLQRVTLRCPIYPGPRVTGVDVPITKQLSISFALLVWRELIVRSWKGIWRLRLKKNMSKEFGHSKC